MAKGKIQNITTATNRLLYDKSDRRAEQYIRNYIKEQAPIANKRLSALRKEELTEYAASRALAYTRREQESASKNYFAKQTDNRSLDDLIREAQEINFFLSRKTSTVEGARAAQEAHLAGIEELRALGYNVTNDHEQLRRMSKILGNSGNKFSRGLKYEIMDTISQYMDEVDDKEIQLEIDRFASGEIEYNDIITNLELRRK